MAKTSESQTTSNNAANEEEKLDELDDSKSSPTVDEVAILKEELEQLKDSVASSKEIERDLKEQLAASNEELEELKLKVDEVEVCRSEVTITFELKGIEDLLTGSKQERVSKHFTCEGELQII